MRRKNGSGILKKTCRVCFNQFNARHDRPGLYCSRSCASKNKIQISYKIIKSCLICNKSFQIRRYRKSTAFFCSKECKRQNMPKGKNHVNWRGGIGRSWKSKVLIKKLIKIRRACEICNLDKMLQGHHIIPVSVNKDLECDVNNIQILCKLCHAKQHPALAKFILKGAIYE